MSRPGPGDDSFLARWSRRKSAERAGAPEREPAVEPADPPEGPAAPAGAQVEEDRLSAAELLARHQLPDPQTLTADDQFDAFMRSGVPQRLRRLALRRLWGLDPVYANLDGLLEYDRDYTDAATVVAGMKTVFKIGRGAAPDPEPEPEPAGPDAGEDAPPDGDEVRGDGEKVAADEPGPDAAQDAATDPDTAAVAESTPPVVDHAGGASGAVVEGDSTATKKSGDSARATSEGRSGERPRLRRMVFHMPESGPAPDK